MQHSVAAAAPTSMLLLVACALGPGAPAHRSGPAPADGPVIVNVTNNYSLPVEVSAVGAGTVYRMGIVYPGLAGRFVLRQIMLATGGMVEFVAQPAGTEPPVRSGGVLLKHGDVVDFEVTTHLLASYAAVRP